MILAEEKYERFLSSRPVIAVGSAIKVRGNWYQVKKVNYKWAEGFKFDHWILALANRRRLNHD